MRWTRRRLLVLAVVAVALACAGVAIWCHVDGRKGPAATTRPGKVAITIGKDTTYITGPLNADGTVNYVAYLNAERSKGVAPENNAEVILARAIGPEFWPKEVRDEGFKQMGMARPPADGAYFVSFSKYAERVGGKVTDKDREDLDSAVRRPWSARRYPIVAGWLTAHAIPLTLIAEATNRPRAYFPLISPSARPRIADVAYLPFTTLSDAGKALTARAMLKFQAGDLQASWADLMASRRLARLMSQGGRLMDWVFAMSMEASACEGCRAFITRGKLSAKQAQACLADLRALPPPPDMRRAVANERFGGLDMIMVLAHERDLPGDAADVAAMLPKHRDGTVDRGALDWNQVLRAYNSWFDRGCDPLSLPDPRLRRRAAKEAYKQFEQTAKRAIARLYALTKVRPAVSGAFKVPEEFRRQMSSDMGRIFGSMLVPTIGTLADRAERTVMLSELVRVGAALMACEAETGRFPAKLAELAPKYLKTLPTDRFSGKPLIYKREGKGCAVYSVGLNLTDDGGIDNRDDEDVHPDDEKDDFVIRFKR